ncbi:alpha/beta fold hydrolase [Streptacidiphilus sp. MAP12-20]|uniref:alpha/beta fold hydrolase n=1 Tax=Streptacidiphilus sp. MAP12-20 TaxID=3156299 RepID=UPI003516A278
MIPGADGRAWYWHRLVPELHARGHETVVLDMPTRDDAGLDAFADAVVDAIGGRVRPVLVAQSLAGFTAPLVCMRVPVSELVLVNAMVPAPGESAGEWWGNTGHAQARAEHARAEGRAPDAPFDPRVDFFHDVPAEVTDVALAEEIGSPPAALFGQPWPLQSWPDVPTRFLQGRDDRFFPLEFQRRLVKERLGLTLEEVPGGHLNALSRPAELAATL